MKFNYINLIISENKEALYFSPILYDPRYQLRSETAKIEPQATGEN